MLKKSITKQYNAFAEGFRILCDGPATRLFNAQVCGQPGGAVRGSLPGQCPSGAAGGPTACLFNAHVPLMYRSCGPGSTHKWQSSWMCSAGVASGRDGPIAWPPPPRSHVLAPFCIGAGAVGVRQPEPGL